MRKRKKRKTSLYKRLFIVFVELIIVLNILRYAAFFKKDVDDGKVHLIFDNDLISDLESDIYIDNNDIIYLSKDDMTNLFDNNLYEEKTENNTVKLISTCENKIMTIVENENHIFVNGVRKKIRGSLINKDDTYYIPISELQDIYNIELNYINDKKIVDIEFLSKEKETAYVNRNIKLKYKMTNISKNLQNINQGESVTIIEDMKGSWTRVKTKEGNIGYVKDRRLAEKTKVRENLDKVKYDDLDLNSDTIRTLKKEDLDENIETLIENSDKRQELINKIVDSSIANSLKGVKICFYDIQNKDNYYRFLIELKPYLQDYGMCLIVSKDDNLDTKKLEKIADILIEKGE